MKILIISNSSVGLVKFRKELILKLKEKHELYIATKLEECALELKELSDNLIEVEMDRRGTNLRLEWKLFCQYDKIIKRVNPDMVITYTIKPNIYAGILARFKKIPYAVNITGLGSTFQEKGLFMKGIIKLYRIALKKARVVFFENKGNARIFLEHRITDKEHKCVLNGAGVDLQDFCFHAYPEEGRDGFLFMGRIMKEKGVEELFCAMEKLHSLYPTAVLNLLGEYEENYERKVKQLSEQGIVNYIGWVSDVKPYIENCFCTVLPSWHEGMSNTLLECAAMGRPVITSDIPGCREAVVIGESGFLAKAKDSESLFLAMKAFYELPYSDKVSMAEAARRHMEEKFDKTEVVEKTIKRMELE